ncbi:MAG: zinc ribbon domain-containing protein [Eubacterium sp.]|nr:zinc ribbon domain-containing protein [Eubacterium sp.]
MNCPKCNKEIEQSFKVCPYCGEILSKEKASKNNNKKIIAIITAAVLSMALILCVLLPIISNSKASTYIEQENYKKAYQTISKFAWNPICNNNNQIASVGYANEQFSNKEYENALKTLDGINSKEAKELKEKCNREIQMNKLADYSFLDTLKKSVEWRNAKADEGKTSNDELVNYELNLLKDFPDKEYYNDDIKASAKKYVDGLQKQNEALKLEHSEYQIKWHDGMADRFEALKTLCENYDLLKDDNELYTTYISKAEYWRKYSDEINAIDKDLNTRLDNIQFDTDGYNDYYFTYKNGTTYSYNIWFYIDYYKGSTKVSRDEPYIENVKPNKKIKVSSYVSDKWETCEILWEIEPIIE